MSLKFVTLILCFAISIRTASPWSSTINSLLQAKNKVADNKEYAVLVQRVTAGVQLAMEECKEAFKWDKWNCPATAFSRQNNKQETREKAYTDTLTAAAVIYTITKDCVEGTIQNCGCNTDFHESLQSLPEYKAYVEKDWTWGGCSADPSYGENLVLKVLEKRDDYTASDPQAYISRHNNRIGREIVREKLLKVCKCHGISGSCTLQTCWLAMSTFAEIAQELKERYNNAVKVSFEDIRKGITLGNNARHTPLEAGEQNITESNNPLLTDNLLYLDDSPDYCLNDDSTGWPGTKGRVCSKNRQNANVTNAEKKSCKNLCRSCGYRIKKQRRRVLRRCNCNFIWCCRVECQYCEETLEEHYCV